ncbi:MAG: hypothetical protein DCO96_05990 [Fluviicola sp. XM-24bin1]|nr:MAG: hypothetical protein DCO96_05990 [Fluviicola sp. XM-24bin1]
MNRIKPSHIFWLMLLVGIVIRLMIIFQPEGELLTRWGSDDLYYYSQIAGHVTAGDGFTFDGINPTNGFQPLFLFTLIPFGKWLLNDWYASWVIVSLIVTLLSVLTCFQLRKWAREMGWSDWLAVILPSVFILHPKILSVTFNGTEGALSFLMLVLVLRAFLWIRDQRNFWWTAIVFSLFVITRMEFSVLLFGLFVLAMLQKQSFKQWLLVSIGPVIVFVSWLLINYAYFGSIIPSSGQAKAIHAGWYDFPFWEGFKGAIGTVFYAESGLSWMVLVATLLGVYTIYNRKDRNLWRLLLFLGTVGTILISISIITLHGFRDWYLVPYFLFMVIVISHGMDWFSNKRNIIIPSLSLLLIAIWSEAQLNPRKFEGQEVINVCEEVREFAPKGTFIGVFNAGLPGACLGDRFNVINLDGVVNNRVLPYLENATMDQYAEDQTLILLMDNKASLEFFQNRGMKTKPFTDFREASQSWRLDIVLTKFSMIMSN